MVTLTDRQVKILKSIIDEYIETALPVGSETIEKKYNLGVSPATIRNEMVRLTEEGFFKKSHSSAGRVPTSLALKYYVSNLLKEQGLSLRDEVAVKERAWSCRNEFDKLMRELTRELAVRTRELAVAATDEGNIYTAGMANILDAPEFFDIDLTKALFCHLEEVDFWRQLLSRQVEAEPLGFLFGSDWGNELFEPCGLVYRRFELGGKKGVIGVIGPARINYNKIFPTVRYFGELLDEIFRSW